MNFLAEFDVLYNLFFLGNFLAGVCSLFLFPLLCFLLLYFLPFFAFGEITGFLAFRIFLF